MFSAIPVVDGTAAPEGFTDGLPMDGAYLAIDTASAIANHHQGLPFTAAGRLAASLDAAITQEMFHGGAAPIDAAGRLAFGTTPAFYTHGVPYTAANQIAYTLS